MRNLNGYGSINRLKGTRHTTAIMLCLVGVDPLVPKRILGHSTADMTEPVYVHIPDETLLNAIDKNLRTMTCL